MKVTIAGLSVTVPEGEYKALVEVMGHLLAVKERQEETDTMFEPLKQTIELLKSYGQPLPEDTNQPMIVRPLHTPYIHVYVCASLSQRMYVFGYT